MRVPIVIAVLALVAVLLASLDMSDVARAAGRTADPPKDSVSYAGAVDLHEYRIGECQYIGMGLGTSSGVLTHSGECDNPRHRR